MVLSYNPNFEDFDNEFEWLKKKKSKKQYKSFSAKREETTNKKFS